MVGLSCIKCDAEAQVADVLAAELEAAVQVIALLTAPQSWLEEVM
jgi:hypothetical protein